MAYGTKARRNHHYKSLRADGFDAISAWNGARSTMRFFDGINKEAIQSFVADCAADGVECSSDQAADILEERWMVNGGAEKLAAFKAA